mmetsp:Transcript_26672/g.55362  ORF Transcript_26672/g.55362 Transcript_26672/m.55362 type:complete len:221 (+) Transcript_26672:1219-1881(+)
MKCSRKLSIRIGDVRLAVATQMGAAQAQHGAGAKDAAILRAYSYHLICWRSYENLLLLVSICNGFPQALPDGRIGKPGLIATDLHTTKSHHSHAHIRGRWWRCWWLSSRWRRLNRSLRWHGCWNQCTCFRRRLRGVFHLLRLQPLQDLLFDRWDLGPSRSLWETARQGLFGHLLGLLFQVIIIPHDSLCAVLGSTMDSQCFSLHHEVGKPNTQSWSGFQG